MPRLPGRAFVAALVALAIVPAAADAAWTSTAGPPTVMTGTAAGEELNLRFDQASSLVRHYESVGFGSFASEEDFDTTAVGQQSTDGTKPITVNANGGADVLTVGVVYPFGDGLSHFTGDLSFNGGAGDDSVTWSDKGSFVGRSFTFLPASIIGSGGGALNWTGTERVALEAGTGDDRITVPATLGLAGTINAGPGDDTVVLGDGASLGAPIDEGIGADTIDYGAWTSPVVADLAASERYRAQLSGVRARPASAALYEGDVTLTYERGSGQVSYSAGATVQAAELMGSRIAAGTPETADSALTTLFDTGAGAAWSCSTSQVDFARMCSRTQTGLALPAGRLADLRAGNVAFVASTDEGSMRDSFRYETEVGSGSGIAGAVTGVENLVGGSGPDTLTGSDAANRFTGGPGDDAVSGAGGNDTLDGGAGTDTLSGGDGDDVITSADGGTADVVRCGAGADIVIADAADLADPDCESVVRPPGPPPPPPTVVERVVPVPLTNVTFALVSLQDLKGAVLKSRAKLTVGKDGRALTLVSGCRAATTCTTDVRIFLGKAPASPFASKPKTAPVATGTLTVPAGEARAAPIRLTSSGIKTLAKAKKRTSTATIVLRTTDRSGHSRTSSSSVTLTGPKIATRKK